MNLFSLWSRALGQQDFKIPVGQYIVLQVFFYLPLEQQLDRIFNAMP